MITRPAYCIERLKEESCDKQNEARTVDDIRQTQKRYIEMIDSVMKRKECPKYYNNMPSCNGCITPNKW